VFQERLGTAQGRVVVTTRVIDLRQHDNEAKLRPVLGFEGALVRAEQVHGALVVPVSEAQEAVRGADGLATRSRLALMALGADCPGIALLGEGAVAVAHSGWRGAVADIGPNAVAALVAWGEKASEMRAFVGPGIGVCCFEVGDEVVEAFEKAHGPMGSLVRRPRKAHIDLKGAIARRLVEKAGLRPENVVVAPECTRCSEALFFSRRREGPGCGHHAVIAHLR
jgi:YfiH family protein